MGPSQRHMLLVQCAWIHSIFPKWWIFAFEGLSDFQPFIRPSIQWVLDPVPADWVRGRLHPGQYIIVLTKRKGEPFMLTFISMASLESSNKLARMPLHPVTCPETDSNSQPSCFKASTMRLSFPEMLFFLEVLKARLTTQEPCWKTSGWFCRQLFQTLFKLTLVSLVTWI